LSDRYFAFAHTCVVDFGMPAAGEIDRDVLAVVGVSRDVKTRTAGLEGRSVCVMRKMKYQG
jgi:hypothetical protein